MLKIYVKNNADIHTYAKILCQIIFRKPYNYRVNGLHKYPMGKILNGTCFDKMELKPIGKIVHSANNHRSP